MKIQLVFEGATKEKRTTDRIRKITRRESTSKSREHTIKKSKDLSRGRENTSTAQWAKANNELRTEDPLDLLFGLRKCARSVLDYNVKRNNQPDK